MAPKLYKATILKSHEIAPQTKCYHFDFDGLADFDFKAGQFAMIWIDGVTNEKGVLLKRAYSIVSCPAHKEHLELCVMAEKPGSFAEQLHKLPVGATINLQGPFGRFVLTEKCDDDLIFIAGGTGIAPLLSMIRSVVHEKRKNKMVLFYSIKDHERYLYREEIEKLASQDHNFHPIIHFTSPDVKDWEGELGRIDAKRIKKYLGEDLSKCKVFLCGARDMVKGLNEVILDLGAKPEHIFKESWG